MILDRAMEDEREEDPGVDLSTEEYDSGEDEAELNELAERLADEATDEGIARFECPSQRNRLVKVLGVLRELQRSHLDSRQSEVILKAAGTHRPYAVATILSRDAWVHMSE